MRKPEWRPVLQEPKRTKSTCRTGAYRGAWPACVSNTFNYSEKSRRLPGGSASRVGGCSPWEVLSSHDYPFLCLLAGSAWGKPCRARAWGLILSGEPDFLPAAGGTWWRCGCFFDLGRQEGMSQAAKNVPPFSKHHPVDLWLGLLAQTS